MYLGFPRRRERQLKVARLCTSEYQAEMMLLKTAAFADLVVVQISVEEHAPIASRRFEF